MARSGRSAEGEAPRILLVGLRPEEEDAIARELAAADRPARPELVEGVTLRAVSEPEEAASTVRRGRVQAVVCSYSSYPVLLDSLLGPSGTLVATPALVLAPTGSERLAAGLLEREGTDVLHQAGNYRPLLVAWVRRAVGRREPSWGEVGRIVRHEINNPLTGVLGNAELILADPERLPADVRSRLRTIVDLAVRMRDVVRSLEVRLQRPEPFLPSASPPPGPFELLARELVR